uniref:Zinc finger protein n=1 Tax=Panagrellus redivivus TaxID=6233 RepID=A0A7E4VTJ7_PANRE
MTAVGGSKKDYSDKAFSSFSACHNNIDDKNKQEHPRHDDCTEVKKNQCFQAEAFPFEALRLRKRDKVHFMDGRSKQWLQDCSFCKENWSCRSTSTVPSVTIYLQTTIFGCVFMRTLVV